MALQLNALQTYTIRRKVYNVMQYCVIWNGLSCMTHDRRATVHEQTHIAKRLAAVG